MGDECTGGEREARIRGVKVEWRDAKTVCLCVSSRVQRVERVIVQSACEIFRIASIAPSRYIRLYTHHRTPPLPAPFRPDRTTRTCDTAHKTLYTKRTHHMRARTVQCRPRLTALPVSTPFALPPRASPQSRVYLFQTMPSCSCARSASCPSKVVVQTLHMLVVRL